MNPLEHKPSQINICKLCEVSVGGLEDIFPLHICVTVMYMLLFVSFYLPNCFGTYMESNYVCPFPHIH